MGKQSELKNKIKKLRAEIKKCPQGTININSNGGKIKYYQNKGGTRKYLSQSNEELKNGLIRKKYLQSDLKDALEKIIVDACVKKYASLEHRAEKLLKENKEFSERLADYFSVENEELAAWVQADYTRNSNYSDHLKHRSSSGNLVRSKSEEMIDTLLFMNRIPYRYECELLLNGITYYPDFTVRHPQTGDTYYWEHVGLIDDYDYRQKFLHKFDVYAQNGILPSKNLIITYESADAPFSTEQAMKVIDDYFKK